MFPMHKSLDNFLEAPDGAGKLLAHARLLVKLARIYALIAPENLRQASQLANYKSGTVVVHAGSGAVAAKLRQLAPTLAAGFSQRGVECTGVLVKVQAPESRTQSMASTKKPLAPGACNALNELRASLPETPLRHAIDALLERSAKS